MSGSGWTHFNPVRIVYARGALAQVGDHVRYQRAVLVTSPGFTRRGVVARLREALGDRLVAVLDDVRPNPDVVDIDRQAGSLATLAPDCIIALGGGSSIDTAKALARLLSQPAGTTLAAHFREGAPLASAPALPVVAIPTTSGTGAEVTPFGTVWDFAERRKYSVTGPDLFPELALLDPELTSGLPPEVTISSGLDAVSHAMESTWNHHATPVTLGLAAKSLQLSLPALPRLHDDPDDIDARGAMMQASLLAGIAISQTRTALAHSISYPLTTHFDLPHGIACSFSLPALLEFNAHADDGRLRDLAAATGHANTADMAASLRGLFRKLDLAGLFLRYVPDMQAMAGLSGQMLTPGRADNNLRAVSPSDVDALLADVIEQLKAGYA